MSAGSHSDIDMDLSFPVPPNKPTANGDAGILQRAVGNAGKPPKPPVPRAKDGDVVDTFWDIPPIEFPAHDPSDEPADGPRHAAPKGVPSTAETRVIASADATNLANSASDVGADTGTTVLEASLPVDGETTVRMTDASGVTSPAPSDRSQETSSFEGARLFPESGPAAQETAVIGTVPSLDFGSVISGKSPAEIPPTIAPVGGSVADDAHGMGNSEPPVKKRSHKSVIIAIVSVVLVAAAAVGGVLLWHNRENDADHTAALSTCTGASEEYNTARDALDQALADTKDEQAITADQVADAATVSSLSDAIDEANAISAAAACGTSLSAVDLQHNAKTNQDLAQQLTDSVGKVTDAAKAVADSRDAKAEADKTNARNALQTAVNDAQTLLDNSLWAVADNTTRVTLEEAINAANELLQQDNPDLAALQNAQAALQLASDGVNSSMQELAAQNATANNGYYDYGYAGNLGGPTDTDDDNGDVTPPTTSPPSVEPENPNLNENQDDGNKVSPEPAEGE